MSEEDVLAEHWEAEGLIRRPVTASGDDGSLGLGIVRDATPPEGGWPAYVPPKPSRRVRLLRRSRRVRAGLAGRVHRFARWIGNEPDDYQDDEW